LFWFNNSLEVLPKPNEIITALDSLIKQGLIKELLTSLYLNLYSIFWVLLISLNIVYLTVLPFFRPIANLISKMRFLSLVGFSLIFTILLGGGFQLKVSLMVLGMVVFFVTSMLNIIEDIPKEQFDYARTLKMSEWRVVLEVVILGTADKVFDSLRQNAAIGWMMLTMVEGIVRSDGGIGAMLLNQQKYLKLPEVFAIQIVIIFTGLFQDFIIKSLKNAVCPYSSLILERK
jgi:NitT/TauT family transport system permease protein